MIEKDHLGDSSSEKDCCSMTDIGQPVRKPSSESSAEVIFGVKSPLDSEDGFRTGCQSVLLRTPITQVIFFNQDTIIILHLL